MTVEDANKIIINSGLNIRIKNPGISGKNATVISQSLTSGAAVEKNSVVELEIVYFDFED